MLTKSLVHDILLLASKDELFKYLWKFASSETE